MLYFRTFDLFLCFSISVGRFLGNLGSNLISPKILLYSFKGDWIQGETEHNISLRFGRGIQQAAVVFMMS